MELQNDQGAKNVQRKLSGPRPFHPRPCTGEKVKPPRQKTTSHFHVFSIMDPHSLTVFACFFRCGILAISYGFLEPRRSKTHAKPLDGLSKSRFHAFRKIRLSDHHLGSLWKSFCTPLATKVLFVLDCRGSKLWCGFDMAKKSLSFSSVWSKAPGRVPRSFPTIQFPKEIFCYIRRIEAIG